MMRVLPWFIVACAVSLSEPGNANEFVPKRNPFQFASAPKSQAQHAQSAPKAKKVTPPQFVLRATLAAGDQSVANIDGRMVTIGQSVDGFVLQSVTPGTATFTKEGRTFVFKLAKP